MVAFGGGWSWVPRALEALQRNTADPYEVILVDNGGNEDPHVLDGWNVDLVRNESNLGFGPGSNQGAARARSDVLIFLNTDVLVEPGWMPPLLDRLAEKGVGGVFPAKIHLDGTMQEAGAFITGDANAYIYGDGEAADEPAFAFSREVDYGSAAAMCLTRTTFESVSGFDSAYRHAYFEDADLCFRLRSRGLRLLYEPRSRVIHARGVATPAAVNEIYASNREVFLKRWGNVIKGRPSYARIADDETARISTRDAHADPRLLLIDGANDLLMQTARNLALTYPRARVTLLAERIERPLEAALLESGVEAVQTTRRDEWLSIRRDHYSHVVAGAAWIDTVRTTQPDAVVLSSTAELERILARNATGTT